MAHRGWALGGDWRQWRQRLQSADGGMQGAVVVALRWWRMSMFDTQAVGRPDMGAANPLYASDSLRWERELEICEVRLRPTRGRPPKYPFHLHAGY